MPIPDYGDFLNIDFIGDNKLLEPQDVSCFQNRLLPFAASPLYTVEIISAKKLTRGEDVKVVYDLALDIEDIHHDFEPGDTVGILPCNNEREVEELLTRLNLTSVADVPYSLSIMSGTTKKKASVPSHIPKSGTLREVFLKCVDIRTVPKKLFLRSLIRYTTQQDEIKRLQDLCSVTGSKQYNEFVNETRGLLKLLETFSSCYPPVERLLENLPPLQPRPYSISSSALFKNSKKELHITFAVIDIDQETRGVCTGWLEKCIKEFFNNEKKTDKIENLLNDLHIELPNKTSIPLYFRKSNIFRLPTITATPLIMIGPGTGVAPFVGFLEHRFMQPDVKFGASWLFYGCRYSDRDFLYKNELHMFQQNGTLTKLFVCFSRESNKKVYVQDLIKANCKEFVDLVQHHNAIIYVCGDAKNMLKDIRNTVISCLVDVEGMSDDDAKAYVKELERTNRYIQDNWL